MGDEPEEHRFLTEAEAAILLDRSPAEVARLRMRGDLPHLPGKPILYERSDVLALKPIIDAPKSFAQELREARIWAERKHFKRTVLAPPPGHWRRKK